MTERSLLKNPPFVKRHFSSALGRNVTTSANEDGSSPELFSAAQLSEEQRSERL